MRMKRFVKIACVLLFATAAVAACDLTLEPVSGTDSLELRLVCTDPVVKSTPGEDAYNENTLDHIDYFVYAAAAGETCLKHARVLGSELVDNSFKVALKELIDAGSLTDGGKCYVYVVANWPATFSGTESIAALQALTVTSNDFDVNASSTHRFVMDSETAVEASVTSTGSTATVNLYRLAAKLTIQVKIPESILSGEKTYTPDRNSLQVYYLYATKQGTLDGSQMTYSDATKANYFNYPPRHVEVPGQVIDGKYTATAPPFYTYPEAWASRDISAPYFKVVLSWSDGTDTQPYYYKVLLPESMNGQVDRNTLYQFVMNMGVLGSETDEGAVELEGTFYVVDWKTGVEIGTSSNKITRGDYLEIPNDTYYIYAGNSIEIPITSSHNLAISSSATRVTAADWYDYSDPTPTHYTGQNGVNNLRNSATITSADRSSFTFTHPLVSIAEASSTNKPDVSVFDFTVRVQNEAGLNKTIRIIQYPALTIENNTSTGNVFVNWYDQVSLTNKNKYYIYEIHQSWIGNLYGSWDETSLPINGYAYPTSYYDYSGNGNNRTYNYRLTRIGGITTKTMDGSSDNSNPNMYIISTSVAPSGTMIADPRSQTADTDYSWASPRGKDITSGQYRALSYYYPTNGNNINVIAPKFRVASSYGAIPGYFVENTTTVGYVDFTQAKQRCASYQEDGLPAGRWRIPTKAEIEFMIELSNLDVIPSLFTASEYTHTETSWSGTITYSPNYYEGGYWSADGGVIYPWKNGTIGYLTASEFATHSRYSNTNPGYAMGTNGVRCVYDEWYWGSERISDKTKFTWGDAQIQ